MDHQGSVSPRPATVEPPPRRPVGRRGVRYAYVALGWLCVGLGAVGAVVPVMPTTVFLLIGLWAFARGSERFHDWLYTHPRFGPPLQAWQRHGVIRPGAKLGALGAMAASLAVVWAVSSSPVVPAVVAVVLGGVALFILTRPSRAPIKG